MSQEWYYWHKGKGKGPVTLNQLRKLAQSGRLQPTNPLWRKGLPDWVPAAEILDSLPPLLPWYESIWVKVAYGVVMLALIGWTIHSIHSIRLNARPTHTKVNTRATPAKANTRPTSQKVLVPAPFVESKCNLGTQLRFGQNRLIYTSSVSSEEARKLAKFLTLTNFPKSRAVLLLNKCCDTYEVKLVVGGGVMPDQPAVELCKMAGQVLSEHVFDGGKVYIHLCDNENFRTFHVIFPD